MIVPQRNSYVSVIIPTYNRARFLAQCVTSVLQQSYQDFELIIVDDGSTDDTRQIAQELCQRHTDKIRYFYQDHRNAAAARNNGLDEARGELIAFLDSDDYWMPSKLEKQVRYFETYDVDFVHTDRKVVFLTPDKSPSILPMPTQLAENSQALLSGKAFVSTTMLVTKASVMALGGFDESLITTEDTELWLRYAKTYKIGLLNEPLVVVQKHDENQATLDMTQKYADRIVIYKRLLLDSHPWIDKMVWRERLVMTCCGLAAEHLKKGESQEGLSLLRRVVDYQNEDVVMMAI